MKNNILKFTFVKIGIFFIIFISNQPILQAQQDAMYTHYMFNKQVYNPAFTGTDREFICATFLFHNQWTGFEGPNSDKAPTTQTFGIHAPFKNEYIGGIGLYVLNDEQGFEYARSFNLTLSGRLNFSFGSLHYGINGGMVERGIDGTWEPPDKNINDLKIPYQKQSDMLPNLGAGIYLYTDRYFFGYSAQQLLPGTFDWGPSRYIMVAHHYVTAGFNFLWPTNYDFRIMPSLLAKKDPAKLQFDVNINVLYKERFWGGLQYRQEDAIAALLGMKLTPQLQFGYSYDLTTQKLAAYSSGTHEVMLSYCFKIIIKTTPPIPNIIYTPRFL